MAGVDDYPQNLKDAARDSLIDPWRFYNRECVSFVAWRLNNDNGVAFTCFYGGVQWGNAAEWGAAAKKLGITVDNIPAPGAVAWWDTGSLGHVAWVRSIQGDKVNLEEYNLGNDGLYYQRTLPITNPTGYIHIKDLGEPIGYLDECAGGEGVLKVRGWTYDPDSQDTPVSIHVYVGGPAGVGACYTQDAVGRALKADRPRGDLSGAWGYECTLSVAQRGEQPVYVYALNNEAGENPLLYGCPMTASIGEGEYETPTAMHRLYNPNSGEHFYTSSEAEWNDVVEAGWNDEGIGWYAPLKGASVHRLYNRYGGEHHYTLDEDEKDALVEAGWEYEGVGWYSDTAKATPLYREYNPNAFANNHNYTTSWAEHRHLISLGWQDEGIAWYGV